MSPDKFRIKFPSYEPELIRDNKTEEVLQDIKFSKHCFILYEPYDGPVEFLFTGFNEPLLVSFLVMLGQHEELHKFLKTAIICHEKLCKEKKKGMDLYSRALVFVKKHLESFTANQEKEA